MTASVAAIVQGRGICICAGSGGVGKTTTSAALAAGLAARGQKVAVLTIDPAKRLAASLGLDELANEPKRVDPELFERAGIEMRGELWAMMLAAKATLDELGRKHAPDDETRDAILENRIYRQLSNALAGSQEYMAMEKLFELNAEGRYDFLVLDTPPSREALDFLDAPKRLTNFIEGRGMQMFMKPTGFATRVVGRGSSMAFGVLKRVTGLDLISDLSEFFQAFSGMVDGFRERAKRASDLLGAPATPFVVVCGPQGEPITEAVYFHRKLVEAKLPVGGVIVNKVHYEADEEAEGTAEADLHDLFEDKLAERVAQNFADYQALAQRDAENVEHLQRELTPKAVIRIPYLDEDVHDLVALLKIDRYLFASEEQREELAASGAA